MSALKVLYLGFAFPPGAAAALPGRNPAGHVFETALAGALGTAVDLRTAGLSEEMFDSHALDEDASPGVRHDLQLFVPGILGRRPALEQLKQVYLGWAAGGWKPDTVLVYNLTPVYNGFVRWLAEQGHRPKICLLLADSMQIGKPMPWLKRLRYRFKPLIWTEDEMVPYFDAVISLSRAGASWWREKGRPWLWMPGGCEPAAATDPVPREGPLIFGYFGALAAHAGIAELVEASLKCSVPHTLRIGGYGKLSDTLREQAQGAVHIEFAGWLPDLDACLAFGRGCDVLVNPRPAAWGNENNFPSKLFQYVRTGRSVLTTATGDVAEVLGPSALYAETEPLAGGLEAAIGRTAALSREELDQRGAALQERVFREFRWAGQGEAMARFLRGLV